MKILACRIGQKPTLEDLPDTLTARRKFIGAHDLECFHLPGTPFAFIFDANDHAHTLIANRSVILGAWHYCVHGDFFFVRGRRLKGGKVISANVTKADAVMLEAMLTQSECVSRRVQAVETVRVMLERLPTPIKKEDMN